MFYGQQIIHRSSRNVKINGTRLNQRLWRITRWKFGRWIIKFISFCPWEPTKNQNDKSAIWYRRICKHSRHTYFRWKETAIYWINSRNWVERMTPFGQQRWDQFVQINLVRQHGENGIMKSKQLTKTRAKKSAKESNNPCTHSYLLQIGLKVFNVPESILT